MSHIWNCAIRPVLTYGVHAVTLTKKSRVELEKVQGKLLKSALGVSKFCRTTPLLKAMDIQRIDDIISSQQLSLMKTILSNNSRANLFYSMCLRDCVTSSPHKNTLITDITRTCDKHSIDFARYVCDDNYTKSCNIKLKHDNGED